MSLNLHFSSLTPHTYASVPACQKLKLPHKQTSWGRLHFRLELYHQIVEETVETEIIEQLSCFNQRDIFLDGCVQNYTQLVKVLKANEVYIHPG